MEDLATKLNASVVENVFYNDDGQGQFDPADEALDLGVSEMNVCKTSEANVMSYCASLHAVRTFGWKGVDKITVIRDPVDRAWSMYRFSLTGCYHCEEMNNVLKKVLNGTFVGRKGKGDDGDGQNFVYSPNDSCVSVMRYYFLLVTFTYDNTNSLKLGFILLSTKCFSFLSLSHVCGV